MRSRIHSGSRIRQSALAVVKTFLPSSSVNFRAVTGIQHSFSAIFSILEIPDIHRTVAIQFGPMTRELVFFEISTIRERAVRSIHLPISVQHPFFPLAVIPQLVSVQYIDMPVPLSLMEITYIQSAQVLFQTKAMRFPLSGLSVIDTASRSLQSIDFCGRSQAIIRFGLF